MTLSPSVIKKLEQMSGEFIGVGKNVDEIKAFLKTKNIEGLPDDLLKVFSKLTSEKEFPSLMKVCSKPQKAIGALRMAKSILIMDVACLGMDIRMFNEMQNEAEVIAKINPLRAKNKRNQAWTQLRIGAGSVVADIGIILWAASA